MREEKDPKQVNHSANKLLELLSKSARSRILADCETIDLGLKDVLYEANKPITAVYFPLNGVVSMISKMDEGSEIEVATTGNEGMLGMPLFFGTDRTPLKAFSQVPGACLRMPAERFGKHVKREPDFVALLHRFAQALMMQISQSTACNRAHNIDQRCARWLLMTHDRVDRADFSLTHEFLAQMLGVRRATVTEVAGQLQKEKLIRYNRGFINIVNRRGLEKRSCGCYWIIRGEYERMLNNRGK